MKAGTYYVGDLCYVLSEREWHDLCQVILLEGKIIQGEMKMPNGGRRFAVMTTEFGDGEYKDNLGRIYSVDSGTIGCILVEDINYQDKLNCIKEESDLGHIIQFNDDFEVENRSGILCFGTIRIDTKLEEDEFEEDI